VKKRVEIATRGGDTRKRVDFGIGNEHELDRRDE